MNEHDNFNKWCDMWDKASGEMEKAAPAKKSDHFNNNSFFGLTSTDDYNQDNINKDDLSHWQDVLDRTDQIYAPVGSPGDLLTEAKEEKPKKKKKSSPKKKKEDQAENPEVDPEEDGFGAILAKSIGDEDQFVSPNPVHFASVGKDQKLRVTPNFSSGDALSALAKLKSLMYDLECQMLTKEALGSDANELEKRLLGMQKQFDVLSQKLIPDPKTDVS